MTLQREENVNFFISSKEEIQEQCRGWMKSFMEAIAGSDFEAVSEIYEKLRAAKYSGQSYLDDLEEEKRDMRQAYAGYLFAMADSAQLYTRKLQEKREIQNIKTKYRDMIIRTLKEYSVMFHKNLAVILGVSPSELTAVIKLMNPPEIKLINVNHVSKYTIYSLTPVANRYAAELCRKDSGRDRLLAYYLYFSTMKETVEVQKVPVRQKEDEDSCSVFDFCWEMKAAQGGKKKTEENKFRDNRIIPMEDYRNGKNRRIKING